MDDQIDTAETVLSSISTGQYDSDLDKLSLAISERRKRLAVFYGSQLRIGDRVTITSGRPRYIIGVDATVVDVMHTWIKIKLDNAIGKFSGGITLRCPMAMVKKKDS